MICGFNFVLVQIQIVFKFDHWIFRPTLQNLLDGVNFLMFRNNGFINRVDILTRNIGFKGVDRVQLCQIRQDVLRLAGAKSSINFIQARCAVGFNMADGLLPVG